MGPDPGPLWRVFISHTSELRKYPEGEKSYIHAVERAIFRAGHAVADMADFPSTNASPAEECIRRVQECDVYIGVLSARYGSPVRDRPELSYTELEYQTATEAGIPRLMFIMDMDADDLGIPLRELLDRQYGDRQDAFRARLEGMAQRFTGPDQLALLVFHSLQHEKDEQAEKARQRMAEKIERERQPAPQPAARAAKFINRPPVTAPDWFQDRVVETGLIADWLVDPSTRMITVTGRGGIGKTAMVCRLLKALEAGHLPGLAQEQEQEQATTNVGGIVYLSPTGDHEVGYPHLINDLCKLLPPDTAQIIQAHYQDPHNSPAHMMRAVLSALPRGDGPVIVLLDNLESVMDTAHGCLTEGPLQEALETVLRAPEHPLKILITTRLAPTCLLEVQPGAQQQIWLEEGLGPVDARTVLRELDQGGALGLESAADEVLDQLHEHTRGFPRALEAIKGILAANRPKLTPQNLVERTRNLPKNQVVEALVGQAYQALDTKDQQVLRSLAVYPSPVAAVGVDFLLQPYDPTVNTTPVLDRLVRWQLARYDPDHDHYYLHPVDRDYARTRIPHNDPDATEPAYTLAALQARAADYYARIRKPRATWHSIDDVNAQRAEFELRCDTGRYDTAADVLADIDGDLQTWGHYRTVAELHSRLHGHLANPDQKMRHLLSLGNCQYSLGNYPEAIDLYTDLLDLAQANVDPWHRAAALTGLGNCHYALDHYPKAIELHTEALTINLELGHAAGEATNLGNLGSCHYAQGNYPKAIELHTQALTINGQVGHRDGEAGNLGNLGSCQASLGNYARAVELHTQALTIHRELGNRDGEAGNLSSLGACHAAQGNYPKAVELHTQALTIHREIGNRSGEAGDLGDLGACHADLGNYPNAIELHTQAWTIHREIGDRAGISRHLANRAICRSSVGDYSQAMADSEHALDIARDIGALYLEAAVLNCMADTRSRMGVPEAAAGLLQEALGIGDTIGSSQIAVEARSGLAQVRLTSGDPTVALPLIDQAQDFDYPPQRLWLCLLKGAARLALDQPAQAQPAFVEAVQGAAPLLDLAPQNVNALLARALACCGLVLTGDVARVDQAVHDLVHLRAVTDDAAGVLAHVQALFTVLAAHDATGTLAPVREVLLEERRRRPTTVSSAPEDQPPSVAGGDVLNGVSGTQS